MLIFDGHCDTITKMMETKGNIYENDLSLDLKRLSQLDTYIQVFAIFVDPYQYKGFLVHKVLEAIDKLYSEEKKYKDKLRICKSSNDFIRAAKLGKIGGLLSVEGGDVLQGQISTLRMLYMLGVRSMCLTWNNRNEIADGVDCTLTNGGLTPFGVEVIREMNDLGMIIDLSHISERGFWDSINLSKSPIIVSHSNAKKICNHKRNLSDEQIEAVGRNRGVIGINFNPEFLNNQGTATIKDIIKHIEYISSLAGASTVGFGSDFDGIANTPVDIKGVEDITKIIDELLRLNYAEEDVKKIAGKNFLRIVEEVL